MMTKEIKLFPYKEYYPRLHETVFVAPGSKIIGDVEIGRDSSVWYNCVIRGDVNYIKIGTMTNVQDSSMLHVTNGKYPLLIGDRVTIGHSVTLHGCIIKDLSLIGMRSVILDGAVVEENALVAAGSVVKEGFVVPAGKLVAGVPAKIIRDVYGEEISEFEKSADRYLEYTKITVETFRKNNYQFDW